MIGWLSSWLRDRRADMVWNAIIVAFVMVPIASLTVDVPRYFILKSRLQAAADAAAQAAVQQVDIAAFQESGEISLRDDYAAEAHRVFADAAQAMSLGGYSARIVGIGMGDHEVTVRAAGDMRLLFGMTPRVTVSAEATSRYRMVTGGWRMP